MFKKIEVKGNVIDYVQEGNRWVQHWPANRLDEITLSYDMVLDHV
jgi:hypothetical protein